MFQEVTLVARCGVDPEMRYTPNGNAVTKLNVITSKKYTKDDGSLVENKAWWRVTVFGKQAESCNQYLAKGSLVLIKGEMVSDDKGNPKVFQRKDGTYGASFELNANTVKFLSTKNNGGEQQSDGVTSIPSDIGSEVSEDSLPF